VRTGALTLARGPALWFNDSVGVLVFKSVAGNFKATSTVRTAELPAHRARQAMRVSSLAGSRAYSGKVLGTHDKVVAATGGRNCPVG
jgi:hypothetical protein